MGEIEARRGEIGEKLGEIGEILFVALLLVRDQMSGDRDTKQARKAMKLMLQAATFLGGLVYLGLSPDTLNRLEATPSQSTRQTLVQWTVFLQVLSLGLLLLVTLAAILSSIGMWLEGEEAKKAVTGVLSLFIAALAILLTSVILGILLPWGKGWVFSGTVGIFAIVGIFIVGGIVVHTCSSKNRMV